MPDVMTVRVLNCRCTNGSYHDFKKHCHDGRQDLEAAVFVVQVLLKVQFPFAKTFRAVHYSSWKPCGSFEYIIKFV
eukprot:jgi/Botrbrau1/11080/Bobra.0302s0022.1